MVDEAQDLSAIDVKVLLGASSKRRSVTLAGDVAQRLVFDNGFSTWEALLDNWNAGLGLLLGEIRNGDCRHQVHNDKAYAYADLDILLRYSELTRWCLENDSSIHDNHPHSGADTDG